MGSSSHVFKKQKFKRTIFSNNSFSFSQRERGVLESLAKIRNPLVSIPYGILNDIFVTSQVFDVFDLVNFIYHERTNPLTDRPEILNLDGTPQRKPINNFANALLMPLGSITAGYRVKGALHIDNLNKTQVGAFIERNTNKLSPEVKAFFDTYIISKAIGFYNGQMGYKGVLKLKSLPNPSEKNK